MLQPAAHVRTAFRIARDLFASAPPTPADLLPPEDLDSGSRAIARVLSYLDPELRNPERIPKGGALLVGNHGLMGIDSFALYPLLWQHTGRLPRGLGDRALFRVPAVGRAFHRLGAVEGRRDTAVDLLRSGELCLVYPGGSVESFKAPDQRYRLFWQGRTGYARVAMRAQVPVVPITAAGIDHAYRYLWRERFVMRTLFGHGKARYDFPISLGLGLLPLPVKFTFQVGEPIAPPPGAHLADDPEAVEAFHGHVWATAQAQLDAVVRQWQGEPATWLQTLARRVAGPGRMPEIVGDSAP